MGFCTACTNFVKIIVNSNLVTSLQTKNEKTVESYIAGIILKFLLQFKLNSDHFIISFIHQSIHPFR